MFSGTVRNNLDPFDDAGGDHELWSALYECGLAEQVRLSVSALLECRIEAASARLHAPLAAGTHPPAFRCRLGPGMGLQPPTRCPPSLLRGAR